MERIAYDPPKLTRDEATELCVYHLRTATSLFQLVPDDGNNALLTEIDRQCSGGIDEIDIEPAKKWALMMLEAYNRLKDND